MQKETFLFLSTFRIGLKVIFLSLLGIVPVLPSSDIISYGKWYSRFVDFDFYFGDDYYVGLRRDHLELHLQWHSGTEEGPVQDSTVFKYYLARSSPTIVKFLGRGRIKPDKLKGKHSLENT